jgi:hypothetical protein
MHRAPAVSFSTARSRWHLRSIVALSISAVVATVAYSLGQAQSDWQVITVGCTVLVATFVALLDWYRSPPGCLRWNGQHWHWSGFGDQCVCGLSLRMDWQSGVLVSLQCEGQSTVWLWLDACADSNRWKALRRAMVSSQGVSMDEDVPPTRHHGEVA